MGTKLQLVQSNPTPGEIVDPRIARLTATCSLVIGHKPDDMEMLLVIEDVAEIPDDVLFEALRRVRLSEQRVTSPSAAILSFAKVVRREKNEAAAAIAAEKERRFWESKDGRALQEKGAASIARHLDRWVKKSAEVTGERKMGGSTC